MAVRLIASAPSAAEDPETRPATHRSTCFAGDWYDRTLFLRADPSSESLVCVTETRGWAVMNEDTPTASSGDSDRVFDPAAPTADQTARLVQIELQANDTFAGYTIRSCIGQGGMGAVYRASQHRPQRDVALKLMRPGLTSDKALRRFELEAELLGRLTHPGIAQIYEAGIHNGTPFFAMELVDGMTLREWAGATDPSLQERLSLFIRVCDAVHHAHAKGIIHRDLKPSNILVTTDPNTSEPAPKILDFGVARATDADIAATTMHTEVGQLIGTLPYMSPEQIAADPDDLDTRSDVYALGVVLYELLADRLPYDLGKRMIHEAARVIREDDPARLSSVNTRYRGDIETIVAKALEKQRERRYQSALDLGADLKRYLTDEPIAARPPGRWYQITKFAKRNRALVTGIVVAFIALLLGLGGTTWGLIEANQQREAAETAQAAEAKRAEELQQVADFQAAQLGEIDATTMGVRLRRSLIDAAPEDRRATVEQALAGLNFTDIALESLEENIFERTLTAIDDQFAEQPLVQAQLLQTVADTVRDLGLYELATAPQERALAIRRRSLGDDHLMTLTSINSMGYLLDARGLLDEAESHYREALKGRRLQLGNEDADTAVSISNIGFLLQARGELDEAEPYYREAIEIQRKVLGDDHRNTLAAINNLGFLLAAQSRFDEAEKHYREALEGRRRTLGDEHQDTLQSIGNLAHLLEYQSKLDEAEKLSLEALELRRRVLGGEHPDTLQSINNHGSLLMSRGREAEAEQYFRDALFIRRRVLGDEHPSTLRTINNLGAALRAQGKLAEAEPYQREAMLGFQRLFEPSHPNALVATSNLALLLADLDRGEEAILLANQAVAGGQDALGETHWLVGNFMGKQGRALQSLGRYADAAESTQQAHAILIAALGPDHPQTRRVIGYLINLYTAWDQAEPGNGYDAKAAEWRAKLDDANATSDD
jgi:tetratricopeptide (TPR) repeat protein/predicted Ser/Thr protein kinase